MCVAQCVEIRFIGRHLLHVLALFSVVHFYSRMRLRVRKSFTETFLSCARILVDVSVLFDYKIHIVQVHLLLFGVGMASA